jgi:outer membrane beta-barrel protein
MVKYLPIVLLVAAAPTRALAERRNPLEGQPAVRHKVELRKLRFEITPQFLTSTNQDYKNAFGPGVMLQFHIFDWLGIGAQFAYTFNTNTPLENKVRDQLKNVTSYTYPGPQPTLQMHDERVLNINYVTSIFASVVPMWGKLSLFSALFLNYDFFVDGGIGIVGYSQNGCCKNVARPAHPVPGTTETLSDPNTEDPSIFAGTKVGGMIGVGVHLYFNDWIGIELELRDYITRANPGGADVNADRHLTGDDEGPQNNIFFGFGVNLMLPPRAKISP